jgi:hypothetical protein
MPRPLPTPEDDHDRNVLGDIARDGWSVIGIEDSEEGPQYAFSVGMGYTLGTPEIAILGLPFPTAGRLVNDIGDLLRGGKAFAPGERSDDVLSGFLVEFVSINPRYYREYFGYARWLHRGDDFRMLQCVWPDKAGVFPGEEGYNADFFTLQRVLGPMRGLPHGWAFPDPLNVATFTTRAVFDDRRPIVHVCHDADGAWQFHTAEGPQAGEEPMLVCLKNVVDLDPALADLGNLPCGWVADRQPDGSWQRAKREADE